MDLGLQSRSRDTYISIIGGKFTIKVPKGTEGSVTRINKNGIEVSEKQYDSFAGYITSIATKDTEYGKQWLFGMNDGSKDYVFTAPYSDGYSKTILKVLPNIDLTKPVKLTPSVKEEDGKTKKSLFIEQNGATVKHYFKKGENGLPDMELIKVKGNDTWDDTKQMAFLESWVTENVVPKLKNGSVSSLDEFHKELTQGIENEEIGGEDIGF